MKQFILLTHNVRKLESIKLMMGHGIDIQVVDIDTPEIQSNSTAEVAAFSAKWAAEKLHKPCVKMDSGLYIKEFNGFPGPYVRWVDEGIGVKKFYELLKNIRNRKSYIECSVAYCDPEKEPHVFSGTAQGTISSKQGPEGSFIDRLFVPDDHNPSHLTLGEMRKICPEAVAEIWGRAERKFIKWLKQ